MKLVRLIKQDLYKNMFNWGYIGTVIVICALCFTTSAHVNELNGESLSVLEVLFEKNIVETYNDYNISSIMLFKAAISEYAVLFIPIAISIPFLFSFSEERKSGNIRFNIIRVNSSRYTFSKYISAVLSSGVAVMIAVCLYGVILYFTFPSLSDYDTAAYELIGEGDTFNIVVRKMVTTFMFGCICAIPGIVCSSICLNQYLITCIPFLFFYAWKTTMTKLQVMCFESGKYNEINKLGAYLPDSTLKLVYAKSIDMIIIRIVLLWIIIIVLGCILFCLIRKKQKDRGM